MNQRVHVVMLVGIRVSARHFWVSRSVAISGTWQCCADNGRGFLQIGSHHMRLGQLNFLIYVVVATVKFGVQIFKVLQFEGLDWGNELILTGEGLFMRIDCAVDRAINLHEILVILQAI